jgi:hypothetical protein
MVDDGLVRLTKVLGEIVHEGLANEKVNGVSILDALPHVDLVGYSPVLENPLTSDPASDRPFDLPTPIDAEIIGENQYQIFRTTPDRYFKKVSSDELKIMRARFILVRNYFTPLLVSGKLKDQDKNRFIREYFK